MHPRGHTWLDSVADWRGLRPSPACQPAAHHSSFHPRLPRHRARPSSPAPPRHVPRCSTCHAPATPGPVTRDTTPALAHRWDPPARTTDARTAPPDTRASPDGTHRTAAISPTGPHAHRQHHRGEFMGGSIGTAPAPQYEADVSQFYQNPIGQYGTVSAYQYSPMRLAR